MQTGHTRRVLCDVIGKIGKVRRHLDDYLWYNNKYDNHQSASHQVETCIFVSTIELTKRLLQSRLLIVLYYQLVCQ